MPATKTREPSTDALSGYSVHEAADMFPMLPEDDLQALAEDIAKHGQQEPIWTYQGQILDGRNRLAACRRVGIKPQTMEWRPRTGETPTTFVMSRNLHRRHLTASQRAALAVELEAVLAREPRIVQSTPTFSSGAAAAPQIALSKTKGATVEFESGPQKPRTGQKVTTGRLRDKAAQTMKVSSGYVNDAKALSKVSPERFAKVKSGELTLTAAQDEVVAEASAAGTLDELKLRPGAVRDAMARLDAQNVTKKALPTLPIKLPKASKVTTSATSLTVTVTFGNSDIAEDFLNRLQDDKKCLHLSWTMLDEPVLKKKSRRRQ